ncbi:MAG: ABC transporter ATP-binding protein [Candidatus Sumerlaeota bacterium]|nr:ABC transporter ATP-binding protein [Candidatus Sumerlaeota bacterium]
MSKTLDTRDTDTHRKNGAGPSIILDRQKILSGAVDTRTSDYLRYARQKYGRAASYDKAHSDRYRELLYGGYEPIEAWKVIREFLRYLKPYTSYLVLAGVGFLAASLLATSRVLIVKFLIDEVLQNDNLELLFIACGALAGVHVLRCSISLMCQYLIVYVGGFVVFDVRKRLFDHLQLLHIGFYEREISGKLVTRLIYDVTALQQLIQTGLHTIVLSGFALLTNLALMLVLSWRLTLVSLVVVPLYFVITSYYKLRLYQKSMEVRERRSILTGTAIEVVLGAKVVKSFAMEDDEGRRFSAMLRDNLVPEMDLGVFNIHRSTLLGFITSFALALVYYVGGREIILGAKNGMTIGTFVAFSSMVFQLLQTVTDIANLKLAIISAQTGLERVLAVMAVEPEIKEKPKARVLKDIKGNVEFRDVHFEYETDKEVLRGVSLTARPGEMLALVGPSGSGKTTTINLLTRFYDPRSGAILVDGHDLRDLNLKAYRQHLGIVLQDPFLFSGTIEDNIRYGRPEATAEEVIEAAEQANAMEFITELPEGMDTLVGERGGLLSGGQRQRISIARALLKRPKILILDEATSSLDTESERLVQEAMDRLMYGRTVFVIAHRLSTVQNADKIIVMQKGLVVQQGTHEELIETEGLYQRLYRGSTTQPVRRVAEAETPLFSA